MEQKLITALQNILCGFTPDTEDIQAIRWQLQQLLKKKEMVNFYTLVN